MLNKVKSTCEKIIYNFCDISRPDNSFGIKLIHKSINNNNKKFKNGFVTVRIVWSYDNIGLVYLGFFQSFINIRRKIVEKLNEELSNYKGDFMISCSNRHIVLLAPPLEINPENKLIDNKSASIFTYHPSKKLIDSYINKKEFKYIHSNKFIIENFVFYLINQRLKENFTFLNSNNNSIILITKISVMKVKNVDEIENTKIIPKKCLMLYTINLSPNKDEITIELSVEPVSGYYLFRSSEKEVKIFDEKKFFNSLINYYKNLDKEIFEYLKNFSSLMKENIMMKLNRELDHSNEETQIPLSRKKISKIYYNKNECFLHAYTCFADNELKKHYHKLANQIDLFKKELKNFLEILSEDKAKSRYSVDGVLRSLDLQKELEYKVLDRSTITDLTIIEQTIIERFHLFFSELFLSIMDYKFSDSDRKMYRFLI